MAMDVAKFQALLADLLQESGHPDVVGVTVMETPAVKLNHADGSATYAKVSHTGPASAPAPKQPSWPGYPTAAPTTPAPNGRRTA